MKYSLLIITLLLGACADSVKNTSGGKAYEVLITGSDQKANETLAAQLRALTMEGLPQEEPLLDLSVVTSETLTGGSRYARNLIVVTTGDTARLQYEHNAFAEPQLLINVCREKGQYKYNVREIAKLIVRSELNNGIVTLRKKHNRQAEQMVEEQFGHRLWIPEDLKRSKQGKDFLWFSNDAISAMMNICLFRYASGFVSEEKLKEKTDSMLRANIPGEQQGMWMQIRTSTTSQEAATTVVRGLWEMRNDAMGGPYVSHSRQVGDSIVTVMAFVYAPGKKKRNIIRRLEAALYTLK